VFTDKDYETQKEKEKKQNKITEAILKQENVPFTLLTTEDILNNI
jgi:hypothetical protein